MCQAGMGKPSGLRVDQLPFVGSVQSGQCHPESAAPPREEGSLTQFLSCKQRLISSSVSTTSRNKGAAGPGSGPSRCPLATGQMLNRCPGRKSLRRGHPVLLPILKAHQLPKSALHQGSSLTSTGLPGNKEHCNTTTRVTLRSPEP